MELIAPRPAVTARFDVSLPYDIFATLILLDAPLAGMSEWVLRTRARLGPALAARLHLLVATSRYVPLLWDRLTLVTAEDDGRRAFAPFIKRLRALPAADYRRLALQSVEQRLLSWQLESEPARCAPAALARSRRRLAAYLEAIRAARAARSSRPPLDEPDTRTIADSLLDGECLRDLIVSTLEKIWRDHYRERFTADLPRLEASAAAQRRQGYPPDFAGLLLAVTGRAVPEVMARSLDGVETVEFVPNAHIGPFLVFTPAPPRMTVAYNALGKSAFREPPVARFPAAQRVFPVLDALADEARLRIVEMLRAREMYAQEIALALGVSQSVVSRHLARLEHAGLVRVRREGTTKYYSLDVGSAQTLLASLKELTGVE